MWLRVLCHLWVYHIILISTEKTNQTRIPYADSALFESMICFAKRPLWNSLPALRQRPRKGGIAQFCEVPIFQLPCNGKAMVMEFLALIFHLVTMHLAGIAWAIREVGQYEVLGCACYEHVTSMQHVQTCDRPLIASPWPGKVENLSHHIMIHFDLWWFNDSCMMTFDIHNASEWLLMIHDILWLYDSHSHPKIRVSSSIFILYPGHAQNSRILCARSIWALVRSPMGWSRSTSVAVMWRNTFQFCHTVSNSS